MMCGTHTPKDERRRNNHQTRKEWPQSLFRLLNALVSASQLDCEPVAENSIEAAAESDAYDSREIGEPNHARLEIIRRGAQDKRCSGIQNVEPDLGLNMVSMHDQLDLKIFQIRLSLTMKLPFAKPT